MRKYRHQGFTAAHLERLEEILRAVCQDLGGELVECNGEAHHVHLLVRFPRRWRCPGSSTATTASPRGGCGRGVSDLAGHYWRAK